MIVISDTSPITNLIKIGRIDLLESLYGRVVIPVAVKEEIEFLPEIRLAFSVLDWIRVEELNDQRLYQSLLLTLDRGEAAAIALAIEINADALLIDEIDGRDAARERGLEVIGLVGILIKAKRVGHISSVREEMDALVSKARFWIDAKLYERTLIAAGER